MTITKAFRTYADQCHLAASGGQNAQMSVVYEMPQGEHDYQWMEGLWSAEFKPGGMHTEALLIAVCLLAFDKVTCPPGRRPKLHQVQVFSRFNPCPNCAWGLTKFRDKLKLRMTNTDTAKFDFADRGNVFMPYEGTKQISAQEAQLRATAASNDLLKAGWSYETVSHGIQSVKYPT